MRKYLLLTTLLLFTGLSFGMLQAQNRPVGDWVSGQFDPAPVQQRNAPEDPLVVPTERTCGHTEQMRANFAQFPELQGTYQAHLEDVERRIAEGDYNPATEGVITIPTVVHVIYRTNQQNISTAQVQSQIRILNEDYRRQNTDAANTINQFLSVAGDLGVEFCLADRDPNGNPTDGITRTQTSTVNIGLTNQYYTAAPAWNRNNYLNMWVCELGNNLLGFAQFPGTAPANRDGVVINWRYFGDVGTATAPYNLGRTATHEVGHWLGLRHIWGDGDCSVDDGVADTPIAGAPNYSCNTSKVSCGTTDMVQNYMDYTNDGCMNIFTQGQGAVVNAVLSGTRGSLVFSNGCQAPTGGGGCDTTEVNFPLAGTAQVLLSGGSGAWGFVSGHNNYGDVSKADYFDNANNASQVIGARLQFGVAASSGPTAKVTVHVWDDNNGVPGTQLNSVDLLIDDIIANQGDVTVNFPTAVNVTGPYYVGIGLTYAPGDTVALVHNTDGDVPVATAWEQWSGGGNWYRYDSTDTWGIDVGHAIFPLTFGPNFTMTVTPANPTITTVGGSISLQATGATNYSWSPASGLSCTNCANPTANPSVTTTYTVQGFDATNSCSVTQQVTVTVSTVSIDDGLFADGIAAYPNPSDGNFIVEFERTEISDLHIELFNNVGQKVFTESLEDFSGSFRRIMDMSNMPAGVYHLRVTDGEKQNFKKLIFE